MEGSGDNLILLLLGELDEVYSISGNTDSELRIFFGMSLSVKKRLTGENVYVEVMATLLYIAVKESYEIIYLILCCCHSYFLSFCFALSFFDRKLFY